MAAEHALDREDEAAVALDEAAAAAGGDAPAHWVVADTLLRLRPLSNGDERLIRARRGRVATAIALDPVSASWRATRCVKDPPGATTRRADCSPAAPSSCRRTRSSCTYPQRPPPVCRTARRRLRCNPLRRLVRRCARFSARLPPAGFDPPSARVPRRWGAARGRARRGLCHWALRGAAAAAGGTGRRILDPSTRMVQRARSVGLYHELVLGELVAWLTEYAHVDAISTRRGRRSRDTSLVCTLAAVARGLRRGGVLVFPTERGDHDASRSSRQALQPRTALRRGGGRRGRPASARFFRAVLSRGRRRSRRRHHRRPPARLTRPDRRHPLYLVDLRQFGDAAAAMLIFLIIGIAWLIVSLFVLSLCVVAKHGDAQLADAQPAYGRLCPVQRAWCSDGRRTRPGRQTPSAACTPSPTRLRPGREPATCAGQPSASGSRRSACPQAVPPS